MTTTQIDAAARTAPLYVVIDADSGERLAGDPEQALIDASAAAEGTSSGIVSAYRSEGGTWAYVPEHLQDHYRGRGEAVASVWVDERRA